MPVDPSSPNGSPRRRVGARTAAHAAAFRPQPEGPDAPVWNKLAEQVAGIGYWHLDVASRAISWSDGLFGLYGLEVGDVPDLEAAMAAIHPDDSGKADALLARAMEFGEDYADQVRLRRADGAWSVLANRTICQLNGAGEVATVFGVVMDITDMAGALRASEARFRVLAESANDLIVQSDLQGAITYVSPSCEAVTGFSPDEIVGRNIAALIHPEDLVRVTSTVLQSLRHAQKPSPCVEYRVLHKDGRELWLEARPAPLIDAASGEAIGITDVVRDVTLRRRLAAELVAKCDEAQSATRAKAEFLANMSHEIRTPLTAILGFSGLLSRRSDLPESAMTCVRTIVAGGEQLLGVVNQVLDFSRLDAGQLELDRQPVRLADFVSDTVDVLRGEAAAKGLALEVSVEAGSPAWVLLDAGRARQVLVNLIANAIKFTPAGGVKVRVSRLGEKQLKIAVTDTGLGIVPALQDRLFKRFSQVDGSVNRGHGGAGLGLAICKGLVELMGGSIGVRSAQGCGSTFWFTLEAPPASQPVDQKAIHDSAPPAAARILVVDDVAVNRILVRAMLEPLGYTLEDAASGREAVAAAARQSFELILMDVQMAGMDGLEATRQIRSAASVNEDTPIVALSANVLPPQVAACRAAGMNDHLAKPIIPAALVTTVARWIHLRSAPDRPRPARKAPEISAAV
jgi:PAS domain S-box-containing protein